MLHSLHCAVPAGSPVAREEAGACTLASIRSIVTSRFVEPHFMFKNISLYAKDWVRRTALHVQEYLPLCQGLGRAVKVDLWKVRDGKQLALRVKAISNSKLLDAVSCLLIVTHGGFDVALNTAMNSTPYPKKGPLKSLCISCGWALFHLGTVEKLNKTETPIL